MLHYRVLGPYNQKLNDSDAVFREMLLRTIPPGALDLLVQKALDPGIKTRSPSPDTPSLRLGRSTCNPVPASIWTVLAHTFCKHRHIVLEPHGQRDSLWFGDDLDFWLEATILYDVQLPHATPKLLPGPEPVDIAEGPLYQSACRLLPLSSAVLIVGYSFGMSGEVMDDFVSWNFVVKALKAFPRPVFVLSPFPDELADTLSHALSSYRVYGIPIFWETLAECLIVRAGADRRLPAMWDDHHLGKLMSQYERALEHR